jgi:hypothetical protein
VVSTDDGKTKAVKNWLVITYHSFNDTLVKEKTAPIPTLLLSVSRMKSE